MNKHKISLKEIKGALTRSEMRKIMAGSGGGSGDVCCCNNNDLSDCGRCMPESMMPSCESGYTMAPCIYG